MFLEEISSLHIADDISNSTTPFSLLTICPRLTLLCPSFLNLYYRVPLRRKYKKLNCTLEKHDSILDFPSFQNSALPKTSGINTAEKEQKNKRKNAEKRRIQRQNKDKKTEVLKTKKETERDVDKGKKSGTKAKISTKSVYDAKLFLAAGGSAISFTPNNSEWVMHHFQRGDGEASGEKPRLKDKMGQFYYEGEKLGKMKKILFHWHLSEGPKFLLLIWTRKSSKEDFQIKSPPRRIISAILPFAKFCFDRSDSLEIHENLKKAENERSILNRLLKLSRDFRLSRPIVLNDFDLALIFDPKNVPTSCQIAGRNIGIVPIYSRIFVEVKLNRNCKKPFFNTHTECLILIHLIPVSILNEPFYTNNKFKTIFYNLQNYFPSITKPSTPNPKSYNPNLRGTSNILTPALQLCRMTSPLSLFFCSLKSPSLPQEKPDSAPIPQKSPIWPRSPHETFLQKVFEINFRTSVFHSSKWDTENNQATNFLMRFRRQTAPTEESFLHKSRVLGVEGAQGRKRETERRTREGKGSNGKRKGNLFLWKSDSSETDFLSSTVAFKFLHRQQKRSAGFQIENATRIAPKFYHGGNIDSKIQNKNSTSFLAEANNTQNHFVNGDRLQNAASASEDEVSFYLFFACKKLVA